ncbi:MAG: penicillin acylase family protein [Saprospiraceae bacterium]|nr:penicillin acylase family protein [Saprospiraceae bacterium]
MNCIPLKDSSNLLYPESFIIHNLLDPVNSKHKIFDVMSTPQTETAKDIANTSFLFTLNELKFNSKTAQSWGKYLNTKIPHMANLPGFSSEILLTGGTSDVLNAISNGSGPSWRMIVELSKDSPKAHVIFPGGQSGHPGSKYYANMINDWKTGSYQTAKFMGRSSIEGNSRVQSF